MSTTKRVVEAPPGEVWAVLADGWLYPLWVVGAARIRGVDASWPKPGSRIHHSVGMWPLLIDDETEVLAARDSRFLHLRARGWPVGEAEVKITLTPSDAGTRVVLEEDVVSGPGVLVPEPFRGLSLTWRNVESLRRLAFIVEGRASR